MNAQIALIATCLALFAFSVSASLEWHVAAVIAGVAAVACLTYAAARS